MCDGLVEQRRENFEHGLEEKVGCGGWALMRSTCGGLLATQSQTGPKDKASESAERAGDTAESGKDKSEGFLQQTGAQVKNMAQGAVDTVKTTLGMAKDDEENDEPVYYKRDRN
ncbi:hypothetical protein M0R45_017966 [Rubus argutus]|uniref:Uncharacterized protein n=1 Tax=Rubus argutus TaxID=59490 RepID=A0AAW1XX76_RUBAR